jgi:hypothetical protein
VLYPPPLLAELAAAVTSKEVMSLPRPALPRPASKCMRGLRPLAPSGDGRKGEWAEGGLGGRGNGRKWEWA